MNLCKRTSLVFLTIVFFLQTGQVKTSVSDYVKTIKNYFSYEEPETDLSDEFMQQIPYEVSSVDEKFISEATKLTGVALSELDSCQQRVVLKLKSDCDKLNDEQLAKMAVHLLNCQSYVEGRTIYPCTEDMSIKECTNKMDPDTWTIYHLMSNRARAVCYSIRQIQFRGMAEQTVNKLMDTARHQLKTLGKVMESQENLHDIAEGTLNTLTEGQEILSKQQKDIQKAQFYGQLAIEDNIKKLSQEKELIVDTHNQLVLMTQRIQRKLEHSNKNLESQADESKQNHKELLEDLLLIQEKAHAIFDRIDESSRLLIEQNENFKSQYEETLRNLAEVNKTVHNLVTLVGGTRQALEERLAWITTALGGTDLAVERLYLILWHAAFMMVSMLTCAFLSARLSTRVMVATLPPLNLVLSLWEFENKMGPLTLATAILFYVLGQGVVLWGLAHKNTVKQALSWKKPETKEATPVRDNEYEFDRSKNDELDDDFNLDGLGSPTPPLSRSGFYGVRSRSRSNTPLVINGGIRGVCGATTRVGTPCKLSSLPGREFCYRHQGGDSVMG